MLIFILTLGVFSIINTEMGVIGILPLIAGTYGVNISTAGLLVSLFALAVAISGPTLPLLLSRFNRKYIMIVVLAAFCICNTISAFATDFTVVLITRVLPAFLHPVYVSLAFAVAASSVPKADMPKAAAKVMVGVSAGMVLGVPVVSYIASLTSLEIAMLFFAFVNGVVLVATIFLVPSMPVKERLSYGTQLRILKEKNVWLAIIAVIFLNGGVFGVYSYLADYLERVTHYSAEFISIALLVYGLANIAGNIIAGKLLSSRAISVVTVFPLALIGVYCLMFFLGDMPLSMAAIVFGWGILGGLNGNITQYWITLSAPHVPDFANALFLVATNLGTCIAAAFCGYFIDNMGIACVVFGGMIFLAFSFVFINAGARKQQENIENILEKTI